jgi:acylphosphatase
MKGANKMAEETQNAPVASAETATQENEKKLYVYYFSDPDAKDPLLRFHIVYSDVEFAELPWHVHTEKPDENLKSPVWSNDVNGWVEDSKDGQAEILAQAQAKIEELDKSKEQFDQTIKSVQENQLTGTAQTLALTKSIKELSDGQANQNKLLASIQNLMLQVASQKQATPTQPTTDNQATGKQENGGN